MQVRYAGINYAVAAIMATQVSTTWNFSLNELLVFRGRDARHGLATRFAAFWAINTGTLLLRIPMLALFTSVMHIHYLVSNLITLVLLFVMRFAVSDQLIWRPAAPARTTRAPPARLDRRRGAPASKSNGRLPRRGFAYAYDIHGFASIASDVPLPELDYFRVASGQRRRRRGDPRGRHPDRASTQDRSHRNARGDAVPGAPRPPRRQLPRRDLRQGEGDRHPASGALPARRVHQCRRGAAALRPRLAGLRAPPFGHGRHRWPRHHAVRPHGHGQDRDDPADAAGARRHLPLRRHDHHLERRPRVFLSQAADDQPSHPRRHRRRPAVAHRAHATRPQEQSPFEEGTRHRPEARPHEPAHHDHERGDADPHPAAEVRGRRPGAMRDRGLGESPTPDPHRPWPPPGRAGEHRGGPGHAHREHRRRLQLPAVPPARPLRPARRRDLPQAPQEGARHHRGDAGQWSEGAAHGPRRLLLGRRYPRLPAPQADVPNLADFRPEVVPDLADFRPDERRRRKARRPECAASMHSTSTSLRALEREGRAGHDRPVATCVHGRPGKGGREALRPQRDRSACPHRRRRRHGDRGGDRLAPVAPERLGLQQ